MMEQAKTNYTAIDIMKLISALLVICIHTAPLADVSESLNFFLVQGVARIAVPFFFVTSAFFFFKGLDFSISLKASKNREKLISYLFRLGKLYLVWTLIYLPLLLVSWSKNGFTFWTFLEFVRDFLFCGSYYHLWFIPALMTGIALAYIGLAFLGEKKTYFIAAFFYLLGSLVNIYSDALFAIPFIKTLIQAYLLVFETTRNGLFFAFLFVTLGYLLTKKEHSLSKNKILMRLSIAFVLYFVEVYLTRFLGYNHDLTCMYLMLVPLSYYLCLYLLQFKDERNTRKLRQLSTLIYVSHLYFVEVISRIPIMGTHSLICFLFVVCFTILFDFILVEFFAKRKSRLLF